MKHISRFLLPPEFLNKPFLTIQQNHCLSSKRRWAIKFSPFIVQYNSQVQNLAQHLIATLRYQNIYTTLKIIYIHPSDPIPNIIFVYIPNNFRKYILIVDLNIHSRSYREKTEFQDVIEYQTTGTVHQIPKHI